MNKPNRPFLFAARSVPTVNKFMFSMEVIMYYKACESVQNNN